MSFIGIPPYTYRHTVSLAIVKGRVGSMLCIVPAFGIAVADFPDELVFRRINIRVIALKHRGQFRETCPATFRPCLHTVRIDSQPFLYGNLLQVDIKTSAIYPCNISGIDVCLVIFSRIQ